MEKHYWKKTGSKKLKNTTYSLMGYSVAARNTGFYIPELRIALDCGVPNSYSPEHIFITHAHLDHCGCLNSVLIDMGEIKPNIYIPKSSEENIKNFIHYTFAMTKNCSSPKIHSKYNLIGVNYGRIYIEIKKMNYVIDIIKSHHTVPCVSYGFSELRTKLKSELYGLSQIELEKLKMTGEKITNTIEFPQFCYIGDTNEKILENELLLKFPTIIIECTFLYEDHLKYAKDDKHMHWNFLKPFIISHPDITFILMHFSFRYTDDEIRKFFKNEDEIKNMSIWI